MREVNEINMDADHRLRMAMSQRQWELEKDIEALERAKIELEGMQDGQVGEITTNANKETSQPTPGNVHSELLVGREPGAVLLGGELHPGGNQSGTGETTPHSEQGRGGKDSSGSNENQERREKQQMRSEKVSEPAKHVMRPTRDELVRGMAVIAESVEELLNGEEDWTVEQLVGRLRFIQRYAHEILGD